MNNHLKAASDRYEGEFKIHPISKIDTEIITNISQALLKLGEDRLRDIIDKWKFLKDEEINDLLLDWHIDTPDKRLKKYDAEGKEIPTIDPKVGKGKGEDEPNAFARDFIELSGDILEVYFIRSFTKDKRWNGTEERLEYCIVVNGDLADDFPYTNKTLLYYSEKLRDDAWGTIKEKLESTNRIVFVK